MLAETTKLLKDIDDFIWGVPLLIMIMGVGILLTVRLGGLQIRCLGKALKFAVGSEEGGSGEVSSFGALCTAMAATVGTGNIVGVATAVTLGGPGALFWMVLAALLGMATKYSEGLLAIKYRVIEKDGRVLGGPFYYIERGMGSGWKWLAKLFAVFGVGAGLLGIGTITQVNGVATAVNGFFDPSNQNTIMLFGREYSWTVVLTAIIVAALTALVVIGGIKRIAGVATFVVPFMAVVYIAACVAILLYNIKEIPAAVVTIVTSAFGFKAAAGGVLGAMFMAMQMGVARGVFSNEAGLGSAPIAAAAARTKEPVRQGLISMTGTFIDTVVICNLTGITLVVTGALDQGLEGVAITTYAFQKGLPWAPQVGSFALMLCLAFFAFTTILGWNYYSERCVKYLSGSNSVVTVYKWLYILAVLIGPFITVSAVWTIADIMNAMMALPNLVALLALNGVIVAETRSYFNRMENKL